MFRAGVFSSWQSVADLRSDGDRDLLDLDLVSQTEALFLVMRDGNAVRSIYQEFTVDHVNAFAKSLLSASIVALLIDFHDCCHCRPRQSDWVSPPRCH